MGDFSNLVKLCFERDVIKKLVFSKSTDPKVIKLTCRPISHRGRKILLSEYSLTGDTVSQRLVREDELPEFVDGECEKFAQVNLITTAGDAERKLSRRGEVILGGDKLKRRLSADDLEVSAMGALEEKKNRILSGSEPFLISLGISDKNGRVHDKKQPKFRQISRFLEYVRDIYSSLPEEGELYILDLCSGKSYLSFAVYHYLTEVMKRKVNMLGIDLKESVMEFCAEKARELSFSGLRFIAGDVRKTPEDKRPDLVLSLHACDIATDIVLDTAARLGAKVILSTPCCQRELSTMLSAESLSFVTRYPKLKGQLAAILTDALRLERLRALGYEVKATELVDPEDTPKNTLICAIKKGKTNEKLVSEYGELLRGLIGSSAEKYIGRIEDED